MNDRGPKSFVINSRDLSRHNTWSVAFHRLLTIETMPIDQRLNAFWDWLSFTKVPRSQIEDILRNSQSEDQAAQAVTGILLKNSHSRPTPQESARILSIVRGLAQALIGREQGEVDARVSRIAAMRTRYKTEASDLASGLLD
jgi:hypothetical protein